jgi:hypothetical protein
MTILDPIQLGSSGRVTRSQHWLRLAVAFAIACCLLGGGDAIAQRPGKAAGKVKPRKANPQDALQVVAFDDFENTHDLMEPFTVAVNPPPVYADGTDWTNQIPNWTVDNSGMGAPGSCLEGAYNGWTAMDVNSWIAQQGVQIGRTALGPIGERNVALVADPDAYDDFNGSASNLFNSYITRNYQLTGDLSKLEIYFDYEFAYENNQRGTVEVSFDGGSTWQMLLDLKQVSGAPANDFIQIGIGETFKATDGDFTPAGSSMLLRIGCLNGTNNWWFAVDNIGVKVNEAGGSDYFDDFEDLVATMVKFQVATPPTAPVTKYDGTDWTDGIPANNPLTGFEFWTVDNSQTPGFSREEAFNGWRALDVKCWVNEQGGQGRSLLDLGSFNANAALVADGDAFYDYDRNLENTGRAPSNSFNTYISRVYDLSGFDNRTLQISFGIEFRAEAAQMGLIEASFDGGTTWVPLQEVVTTDRATGNVPTVKVVEIATDAYLQEFRTYNASLTDNTTPEALKFQAAQSNKMTLRFGYLRAGNNWWMAIDDVKVEAVPITWVKGDANGNGVTNFDDIDPFILALINAEEFANTYPSVTPNVQLDFNGDGLFNFDDIDAFINVLIGN